MRPGEFLAGRPSSFPVPETVGGVIVHHAYGLHEGVADCRTDKFKTALDKVFTHGVRFWRPRWDLFQ
jgi:hypothetical protein